MPCDSNNGWLFVLRVEVLPYLLSGLYAIHDRHAEVSKYDGVAHSILVGPLHLSDSFLAMDAIVYLEVSIDAQAVEHCSHRRDAEFFVVHHEDSIVSKLGVLVIAIKHLVQVT